MGRQLELDHTWTRQEHKGGRKPGLNPRIRHRSREGVECRFPCHVTIKVREDVPSLRTVRLALGARLARAVNRVFGRSGPVLVDRYHVRALRTPREVRNALAYVLMNARRHAAQGGRILSRVLGIDPASSGRWFDGWKRPVFAAGPPLAAAQPVAKPRGWLLAVGWKRSSGLLDPDEIPGRWAKDARVLHSERFNSDH